MHASSRFSSSTNDTSLLSSFSSLTCWQSSLICLFRDIRHPECRKVPGSALPNCELYFPGAQERI